MKKIKFSPFVQFYIKWKHLRHKFLSVKSFQLVVKGFRLKITISKCYDLTAYTQTVLYKKILIPACKNNDYDFFSRNMKMNMAKL